MYEKDLASSLANVAVRRAERGFTFDDLARAATQHRVTVSNVANWLAEARMSGFLQELGFDPGVGDEVHGPRRYRLARRSRAPATDQRATG